MERIHTESRFQVAERPPGFTVPEYAEKFGISVPGAGSRLRRLYAAGKVVYGWAIVNGTRCKIYRPAERK